MLLTVNVFFRLAEKKRMEMGGQARYKFFYEILIIIIMLLDEKFSPE